MTTTEVHLNTTSVEPLSFKKSFENCSKIADYFHRLMGSIQKTTDNGIVGDVASFAKDLSQECNFVSTLNDLIQGKYTLENIMDAFKNCFVKYDPKDIKIVSTVLALRETLAKLCEHFVYFDFVVNFIMRELGLPEESIVHFRALMHGIAKMSLPEEFEKADETILFFKKYSSAVGLKGKLEDLSKTVEELSLAEKAEPSKVLSLIAGACGIGSYALSLLSGIPAYASPGLAGMGVLAGFASYYLTPEKSKEQQTAEETIKKDLDALKAEYLYQNKSIHFPKVTANFHEFEDKAKKMLSEIGSISTREELAAHLKKYQEARSALFLQHEVSGDPIEKAIAEFQAE
jgi:hypothetical protein